MASKLPKWIKKDDAGFHVDPDIIYAQFLAELADKLGEDGPNPDAPGDFWLEIVYQCAKLEVQRLVMAAGLDPRPDAGFIIHIRADGDRKAKWRQANPTGMAVTRATKGGEARICYALLRSEFTGFTLTAGERERLARLGG